LTLLADARVNVRPCPRDLKRASCSQASTAGTASDQPVGGCHGNTLWINVPCMRRDLRGFIRDDLGILVRGTDARRERASRLAPRPIAAVGARLTAAQAQKNRRNTRPPSSPAASIVVGNLPLAGTGHALDRIDSARCEHRLLHHGEARSFAGRARVLLDFLSHGFHLAASWRAVMPPICELATGGAGQYCSLCAKLYTQRWCRRATKPGPLRQYKCHFFEMRNANFMSLCKMDCSPRLSHLRDTPDQFLSVTVA